jgi:hypothetical protein
MLSDSKVVRVLPLSQHRPVLIAIEIQIPLVRQKFVIVKRRNYTGIIFFTLSNPVYHLLITHLMR